MNSIFSSLLLVQYGINLHLCVLKVRIAFALTVRLLKHVSSNSTFGLTKILRVSFDQEKMKFEIYWVGEKLRTCFNHSIKDIFSISHKISLYCEIQYITLDYSERKLGNFFFLVFSGMCKEWRGLWKKGGNFIRQSAWLIWWSSLRLVCFVKTSKFALTRLKFVSFIAVSFHNSFKTRKNYFRITGKLYFYYLLKIVY